MRFQCGTDKPGGIDQLLSNPARSAFLSRAAIRSPDSALLIWLRTRLSRVPALLPVKSHRYLCAQQPFPVQKLQQINLRPHSNYQYITDNIRTGSGFCIIQQFFRIVPPVLQSNGNRGRIHAGTRYFSSDFIILRSPACSGSSTAQVHVPVPVHHDRPHRLQKSAARVVPPARKTGQMMTVMENARTTPENRFQIMLLNNTRPAGQPASDRGGSMKRKVNLRLSKTCLVFQFPSFCLTFPLAAVFLLCQRGFLTTTLTFTKRHGREQTVPRIGWQGKNTDFPKLSISLSTAASHRRRLP